METKKVKPVIMAKIPYHHLHPISLLMYEEAMMKSAVPRVCREQNHAIRFPRWCRKKVSCFISGDQVIQNGAGLGLPLQSGHKVLHFDRLPTP
jgi:hypothetical protein